MSEPLNDWRDHPVIVDVLSRARVAGYDPQRVTGVSIYGCVDAHGTDRLGAMRRSAHAHTSPRSLTRGTFCIKGGTGRMTHRLLAHEIAHLLVMAGHTKAWRECVTALGHPAEAKRYAR